MSANDTTRDWQPGDGIRCRFFKRAPQNIPCGLPVRTRVTTYNSRPGGPKTTSVTPLCANHADVGASVPSRLAAAAEKAARERLIAAHYDEYLIYIREESARQLAEREEAESSS